MDVRERVFFIASCWQIQWLLWFGGGVKKKKGRQERTERDAGNKEKRLPPFPKNRAALCSQNQEGKELVSQPAHISL